MPLIEGKCKNCGGKLSITDGKNGVCPFCGTSYIAEDAINYNNYNITNATLNIDLAGTTNQKLNNATTHLEKFKDYKKAYILFKEVTELTADDYRGWWGLVRSKTEDFTNINLGSATIYNVASYASNAISVADSNLKDELQQTFDNYLEKVNEWRSEKSSEISTLQKQVQVIKNKKAAAEENLEVIKKQHSTSVARMTIINEFKVNFILVVITLISFFILTLTNFMAFLVLFILFLTGTVAMLIFTASQKDMINKCSQLAAKKEEELKQLNLEIDGLQTKISHICSVLSA